MVKVAQVGAGYWGKNLVRNFAELGALAAIVDPDEKQAVNLSAAFGALAMTFDAVLENQDISGISVATPAETHAEFALRAIAAGKHVYVEKPRIVSK